MVKTAKKDILGAGASQAHGGALLSAILLHLTSEVPNFQEIAASAFFKKSIESKSNGFAVSFAFLQDYRASSEEYDELVLAQIMIFLAKSDQLDQVNEIVVNLTTSDFGE